jgi:hypothetical protein
VFSEEHYSDYEVITFLVSQRASSLGFDIRSKILEDPSVDRAINEGLELLLNNLNRNFYTPISEVPTKLRRNFKRVSEDDLVLKTVLQWIDDYKKPSNVAN